MNSAIEDLLDTLVDNGLLGLDDQTNFLAQCLTAWLNASGRFEKPGSSKKKELDPANVAYQGRVLVSVLTLVPAMVWRLKSHKVKLVSDQAAKLLEDFLSAAAENAGLLDKGVFIDKGKFKARGFLGSGGIARFRDLLWASVGGKEVKKMKEDKITEVAESAKAYVSKSLAKQESIK